MFPVGLTPRLTDFVLRGHRQFLDPRHPWGADRGAFGCLRDEVLRRRRLVVLARRRIMVRKQRRLLSDRPNGDIAVRSRLDGSRSGRLYRLGDGRGNRLERRTLDIGARRGRLSRLDGLGNWTRLLGSLLRLTGSQSSLTL